MNPKKLRFKNKVFTVRYVYLALNGALTAVVNEFSDFGRFNDELPLALAEVLA